MGEPSEKNELEKLKLRIAELENREKKLTRQLKVQNSLYAKILDALPINVFLEDPLGRTIFANKQACEANGLPLEELVGKTVFDLFPKDIAKKNREMDLEVWRKQSLITTEMSAGFRGGESHMFTGKTIVHLPETEKDFLVGFALDITNLKEAEAKIAHMAFHDALTGLPNRWYINSYLDQFKSEKGNFQKMLGVILLDLDHFKVINDTLGHQAGDELLKLAAERLADAVTEDNVLSRIGGDEFVLLLPKLKNKEEAEEVCDMILKAMKEPFKICNQKFSISPSIGISIYPDHGDDLNLLITHADLAMYHSKAKGRNCFSFFTPKLKVRAMKQMGKITAAY
ncbi:diguanylate cyclase domain-containing protein [Neobacillus mesonae]|uniref:diguanylate cyclase domain-containing protein n=1 Tax=Neobacillus mesonae TaxID=1193713 RepID=UPI00203C0704|nr:diguanylate cyclase [Neobacillus mesonae]MCM3567971.1 diguanylate cyclase [Neobacillus mesonae]